MGRSDSFADVMDRLHAGDADMAAEIVRRFARRLVALAARQFDPWLRARADHEDVVQSALKSFFARDRREPFDLADWDDLWGLLAIMTLRKCAHRRDYLRAARRDAAREVPWPAADAAGSWWWALDREPTPDDAAMLGETVEAWLADLGPSERVIVHLGLQGLELPEIAGRLRRSERTVRRVLRRAEERLVRLCAEEIGPS